MNVSMHLRLSGMVGRTRLFMIAPNLYSDRQFPTQMIELQILHIAMLPSSDTCIEKNVTKQSSGRSAHLCCSNGVFFSHPTHLPT
jgi:hypothetical protein